jgi:hypothetical protein
MQLMQEHLQIGLEIVVLHLQSVPFSQLLVLLLLHVLPLVLSHLLGVSQFFQRQQGSGHTKLPSI